MNNKKRQIETMVTYELEVSRISIGLFSMIHDFTSSIVLVKLETALSSEVMAEQLYRSEMVTARKIQFSDFP